VCSLTRCRRGDRCGGRMTKLDVLVCQSVSKGTGNDYGSQISSTDIDSVMKRKPSLSSARTLAIREPRRPTTDQRRAPGLNGKAHGGMAANGPGTRAAGSNDQPSRHSLAEQPACPSVGPQLPSNPTGLGRLRPGEECLMGKGGSERFHRVAERLPVA
jgi:hypothetical protein